MKKTFITLLFIALATASFSQNGALEDGLQYTFTSGSSNFDMTIQNNSWNSGVNIVLNPKAFSIPPTLDLFPSSQVFIIKNITGDIYTIHNISSNLYFTSAIIGNNPTDGSYITQERLVGVNGSGHQQWHIIYDVNSRTYYLQEVATNAVITVQNASITTGAKMILYTPNYGSNQKWVLTRAYPDHLPPPYKNFRYKSSSKVSSDQNSLVTIGKDVTVGPTKFTNSFTVFNLRGRKLLKLIDYSGFATIIRTSSSTQIVNTSKLRKGGYVLQIWDDSYIQTTENKIPLIFKLEKI